MTYELNGGQSPDYLPCRYGASRQVFRGPRRRLEGEYVAFFGGTETYGKFIETPFPALTEETLGLPCVNFGCVNAGVDAFVNDTALLEAAGQASATVVQIMGAQNMSNRLYSVHPRRNDRFINASAMLKAVYREVDFTEFHFTRHLLRELEAISPDRFKMVREELQAAWMARMTLLLSRIKGPVVLLWMAERAPSNDPAEMSDPLFVTAEMIDALREKVANVVVVQTSAQGSACGTEGMLFGPMEEAAARELPGPGLHDAAATALSGALAGVLNRRH
ncbi:DUF6473 family protein [Marinovum sp.]|uniref:DUF6473 family protein n=1 Tax=Marinovum sp. TaxID=2024839 RepID=UPI002B2765AC|nr:DUF6473 family protein [Marinovum sp.]